MFRAGSERDIERRVVQCEQGAEAGRESRMGNGDERKVPGPVERMRVAKQGR